MKISGKDRLINLLAAAWIAACLILYLWLVILPKAQGSV